MINTATGSLQKAGDALTNGLNEVTVYLATIEQIPGFVNYLVFGGVLYYLRKKYLKTDGNTFYRNTTILSAVIMGIVAFYADTLIYFALVMGVVAASPSENRKLAHEHGAVWGIGAYILTVLIAPSGAKLVAISAAIGAFTARTYIATTNETVGMFLSVKIIGAPAFWISNHTPNILSQNSGDNKNSQTKSNQDSGNDKDSQTKSNQDNNQRSSRQHTDDQGNSNSNTPTNDNPSRRKKPVNTDGDDEADENSYTFDWEDPPSVSFDDIGGYDEVKEQLHEEVINPLMSDKEGYERFNVEPTRGLLFHGPPGTGKTMFARALANTLQKDFVELTQADLTHKHVNESPQIIQAMFEQAQERSAVVFIDEAEQLIKERGGGSGNSHQEDSKITNTFLTHLSREHKDFILILTTNKRDQMDEAILRQGRVDSKFEIGLPNRKACLEIFKNELRDVPDDVCSKVIDIHTRKAIESQFSGADIAGVFERAKVMAAQENAEFMTYEHIVEAFKRVKEDK